jgi:hypothetical protein
MKRVRYVGVIELCRLLDDAYTRRHLLTLAKQGKIPGAEKKPSGKQWRFRLTAKLRAWIANTKRSRETKIVRYPRKKPKDPKRESFVIWAHKIEQWFRDNSSYYKSISPEQCAVIATVLRPVAEIYSEFEARCC